MRWSVVALTVLASFVVPRLIRIGFFVNRNSFQSSPMDCFSVESYFDLKGNLLPLYGPEDIAILDSEHVAFIGTDLRKNNSVDGAIVLLEIGTENSKPREGRQLKLVGWEDTEQRFKPHGIDLRKIGGQDYLFVVVHAKPLADSVAIFKIVKVEGKIEELHLVHHVKDSHFRELNDILAVDLSALPFVTSSFHGFAFYVSNCLYNSAPTFGSAFEMLAERPWASVAFCSLDVDSEDWHCQLVLENMLFPNGLALSKNQDRLYVAHSGSHGLKAYSVEHKLASGGQFLQSFVSSVPLVHLHSDQFGVSLLDNIEIEVNSADDGVTLYLAAHQQAWRFLAHMVDESKDAGSVVWKVTIPDAKNQKKFEVKKIFADDGKKLSASAIAAHYQGEKGKPHHLLIGAVFRPVLLHCTFPEDSQ